MAISPISPNNYYLVSPQQKQLLLQIRKTTNFINTGGCTYQFLKKITKTCLLKTSYLRTGAAVYENLNWMERNFNTEKRRSYDLNLVCPKDIRNFERMVDFRTTKSRDLKNILVT